MISNVWLLSNLEWQFDDFSIEAPQFQRQPIWKCFILPSFQKIQNTTTIWNDRMNQSDLKHINELYLINTDFITTNVNIFDIV